MNRNILMLFRGVRFFLVTGDAQCLCSSPLEKKTPHIPELASTSEDPFILTEFQIIFIPFVVQI